MHLRGVVPGGQRGHGGQPAQPRLLGLRADVGADAELLRHALEIQTCI